MHRGKDIKSKMVDLNAVLERKRDAFEEQIAAYAISCSNRIDAYKEATEIQAKLRGLLNGQIETAQLDLAKVLAEKAAAEKQVSVLMTQITVTQKDAAFSSMLVQRRQLEQTAYLTRERNLRQTLTRPQSARTQHS